MSSADDSECRRGFSRILSHLRNWTFLDDPSRRPGKPSLAVGYHISSPVLVNNEFDMIQLLYNIYVGQRESWLSATMLNNDPISFPQQNKSIEKTLKQMKNDTIMEYS